MMWALNNSMNTWYYEALTDCLLMRAPHEDVKGFLIEHAEVHYDLTKRLLSGIRGLTMRFESLIFESAYARVTLFLLYLVENFSITNRKKKELCIRITHRDIASWIGTTRETVSLQIERMKEKGIVRYRGRQIIIPDVSKLQKECASYTCKSRG